MQRVLYIISTLKKSGPVNVLYNIVKNLDRTKYEPIILTLSKEPKDSIKNDFEELGIKCFCLNLSGLKGYFEAKKIKDFVKDIAPDVIHTHCFRSTLFTSLYLKQYKTIATVHCDYDVDFIMAYGNFKGSLMSKLMDFSLKKFNQRVCVSELLCHLLRKKKRFDLIYIDNGIDIEKFKPTENKIDLRQKLNIPMNKRIWIWAGVMIERKNPFLLVEAIKQLNTDDYFIFCGDGHLFSTLKEQTKELSNVILTGNVNNIDEYLQASDYYISTSLSEGLPMSVIEGMASGLPCILSDIEQHKYVLKENTGMLFKTNDVNGLIDKIKDILDADYDAYSSTARETVCKNFSSNLMAQNYQKKYEELFK